MKLKRLVFVFAMVTAVALCAQPMTAFAVNASSLTKDTQTAPAITLLAETVLSNTKAKIDVTNISSGYVRVAYTGGGTAKIKVQVTCPNGTVYTYDLNNGGTYETFPMSEGDGKYKVGVYVNTTGNKYSTAYTTDFTVTLKDQFAPFLAANQFVNFSSKSKATEQAATLTKGMTDEIKKLEAIYNYVIANLTYDKDKAAQVKAGTYSNSVSDVDKTLSSKKGVCYDFAALMAAMLRSQGIPCKLVYGWAGDLYHAWINAYLKDIGWVDSVIYFDGKDWKLMDPTFAQGLKSSEMLVEYIGDGKNYKVKLCY